LGLVVDKFDFVSTDSDWAFDSFLDPKFTRINPKHRDTSN